MNARLYYERSMHALTSTLAMFAQRLPFIKNLCPLFSSPVSLGVATPMTVSFLGTHSLSGQSVLVIPLDGTFTNPADAAIDEDFQWAFTTDRFTMRDVVIEGLPDGLTGGLVTGAPGVGQIVGKPTETGEFTVSIVAWRFVNLGGQSSVPYSLTIRVPAAADPFMVWRDIHFDADDLDNPAIVGPNADPDEDGIENLLEFVLDLNPNEPSKMPSDFVTDPEDDTLFRYEIPLNADAAGLTVVFQESSSLKPDEWTDVDGAEFTRTDTNIVLSVPKGLGKKLYRLRVVL